MSADGEVENAAAEQPMEEVAAAEQPQPAERPAKERKAKAQKEKKPKAAKTASHPPYFQMIKEALVALNEKGGSSPYAIAKYMEEKHKAVLPENFRKMLGLQLKNSAARGKLTKVKASYKLSETGKEEEEGTTKPSKKRPNRAKPSTKTGGALKAKAAKKSETGKKVAPKKTKKPAAAKPKQLKSIKSPATKKAKKATA